MFNKKSGQMGETITWIVATIIIIVILIISIFIATSDLGGSKKVDFPKQDDILASKSFFAYLLTKDTEDKTVYEQLKDDENLNEFNGNLALRIFDEFYKEEYSNVWVGTSSIPVFPIYTSNVFFGDDPGHITKTGGYLATDISSPHVRQIVKLSEGKFVWGGEENKYVEMILTHKP